MSSDSTWFNPADSVRPDFRVQNGQPAQGAHRARHGGRPPSDDGPANGRRLPSAPGSPARWPMPPGQGAASHESAPPYPIIAQYELDDPERRGPLGLVKRRKLEDIPKIKPHEVLVWRVGGRYIVDRRELRAHDDTVVRASSVSVVSVRPDTEVEVSFKIDSQDAAEFTVKVTFICSVLDPVVVVRDGQVNAADALIAYLRGYQDLFNLGLGYPIKEINRVRTEMAVQVKSYMTLRPPKIPGMTITSATVQIETPTVLADIGKLTTEQEIELQKARHAALLDSNEQSHILDKANRMEAISRDPRAALGLAYSDGGMTSPEYAERLHQMAESHLQRDRMDAQAVIARQQELEDRYLQRQHELEERASARRRELEDRFDQRKYELEDRTGQWHYEARQWDREDRKAELQWEHAQVEAQRNHELDAERAQISANIELLKMYAANGHLDTYNADIADLVRRIHGDRGDPKLTAGDRPELTDGPTPGSRESEAGRDH
jgi:hypothetical protein